MSVEKLEVDYNSMQMNVQEFINFTLHYIVDLDILIKRSVGWKLKYTILMFWNIYSFFDNGFSGEHLYNFEVGSLMFHQLDKIAAKKKAKNWKDMIWFSSLF